MPGWTVLLADDEPHITRVVARKLEGAGFEVTISRDGEEALRAALEIVPDVIVTDLQMPHMSGYELAAELRRNVATSSIPIIMLTARGYFLSQDELEQTNIREVMSKPFTARGLLERVMQYVSEPNADDRSVA